MKKGEEVRIKISYDLFGTDVKDDVGIYVSTMGGSGKLLIFFPHVGEWGEFFKQQIKRVNPGSVTKSNREFVSRVKRMKYTFQS